MLKRIFRVPAQQIKTLKNTSRSRFFSMNFSKNNLGYNRFAFSVSKKVDNRSTTRNRLKRIFMLSLEDLPKDKGKGYDILFRINKDAIDKDRETLSKEIKKKLKSINLPNEKNGHLSY